MKKLKKVDIHYYYADSEEYAEVLKLAEKDYARLIAQGYPVVEIVDSSAAYSEGLWVEAGEVSRDKNELDSILKSHHHEA